MGLPIVLGMALSPWTPLLLVAAIGWVVAFPASYFALAVLRYPKPERFRRPLTIWAAVGVPAALILLACRPWLTLVGVAYVAAFAINLAFARRRDERAMTNNVIFILECAAIVPAMWGIAAIPTGWSLAGFTTAPAALWLMTCCCALALAGSTLQVKSLIRERNDARYRIGAQVWALASLACSALVGPMVAGPSGALLVIPFGFMVVRSFAVAGRRLPPGRVGMIELVGFVLLAAVAPFIG